MSLYADDAVIFIKSTQHDMQITYFIVNMFAEASVLRTNLNKTQYSPIQCQDVNMEFLTNVGRVISTFPCIYLGLPLSIKKPSRAMMQPMIQKITDRLPGWARSFLSYPGRDLLV
jgi:hypothetical protein